MTASRRTVLRNTPLILTPDRESPQAWWSQYFRGKTPAQFCRCAVLWVEVEEEEEGWTRERRLHRWRALSTNPWKKETGVSAKTPWACFDTVAFTPRGRWCASLSRERTVTREIVAFMMRQRDLPAGTGLHPVRCTWHLQWQQGRRSAADLPSGSSPSCSVASPAALDESAQKMGLCDGTSACDSKRKKTKKRRKENNSH